MTIATCARQFFRLQADALRWPLEQTAAAAVVADVGALRIRLPGRQFLGALAVIFGYIYIVQHATAVSPFQFTHTLTATDSRTRRRPEQLPSSPPAGGVGRPPLGERPTTAIAAARLDWYSARRSKCAFSATCAGLR